MSEPAVPKYQTALTSGLIGALISMSLSTAGFYFMHANSEGHPVTVTRVTMGQQRIERELDALHAIVTENSRLLSQLAVDVASLKGRAPGDD